MWCRVLLVVIVLTCTFQREIIAEPDDVICVILLSGLRKEDLDVNLLKKLQRHNVNIDKLNNEKTLEKCLLSSERPAQTGLSPAEVFAPTIIDHYETTELPYLSRVNYDYSKYIKMATTSNENDYNKKEIKHNEDTTINTVGKFMNLLKVLEITKTLNSKEAIDISRKNFALETPIASTKKTIESQTKDLEYISKILEKFMAARQALTTTLKPTTEKFDIDLITQQLKSFFNNNNMINNKASFKSASQSPVNESSNNSEPTRKKGSPNVDDFLNTKEVNASGVIEHRIRDTRNLNKSTTVDKTMMQRKPITTVTLPETTTTTTTTNTTAAATTAATSTTTTKKIESKTLPDNIILEIAEKVKASVMRDLKLQASTKSLETATIKTTEVAFNNTDVISTQKKINDATEALEDFMELFQQLKKLKKSKVSPTNPKYKLVQKKNTNNEFHGPINVLYPPLMPINYDAKKQPDNLMPMYVHQINNNPLLPKSNLPQFNKQIKTEKIKTRYDELSDFNINPFQNIGTRVIGNPIVQVVPIIQTDAGEVPPLGIPVPKSVIPVNQNIIVTTKHPMVQYKEGKQHRSRPIGVNRYQDYLPRAYRYNTDSVKQFDTDMERTYRTDVEKTYDSGRAYAQREKYPIAHQLVRHERGQKLKRNRPGPVDNFYEEYLSNIQPIESKSYQSILSRGSNGQRFHEKLERPDEWQEWQNQYRDIENATKRDRRIKVAPRQQLTMSDLKYKARYNDAHFRNFLKTQQKVNDMLEKILANKDKPRSVETPDTVHTISK